MNAEQALHTFWSRFSLPAYDENSVPDSAQLPYITYSISYDSFDNNVSMSVSLWYKSTSWEDITLKAKEIIDSIGHGGIILKTDRGGIWLKRGNPMYQRIGNEDRTIKRIYLNIMAEYIES